MGEPNAENSSDDEVRQAVRRNDEQAEGDENDDRLRDVLEPSRDDDGSDTGQRARGQQRDTGDDRQPHAHTILERTPIDRSNPFAVAHSEHTVAAQMRDGGPEPSAGEAAS